MCLTVSCYSKKFNEETVSQQRTVVEFFFILPPIEGSIDQEIELYCTCKLTKLVYSCWIPDRTLGHKFCPPTAAPCVSTVPCENQRTWAPLIHLGCRLERTYGHTYKYTYGGNSVRGESQSHKTGAFIWISRLQIDLIWRKYTRRRP
jgi:hypothetical protein